MRSDEKNQSVGNNDSKQTSSKRQSDKTFVNEFSAMEIKDALLPDDELIDPLEELIAAGEAVFEVIRNSDMDIKTKSAFFQLEKQFNFYRNLLRRE